MATADPIPVPRKKDWINISFLTLTPIIGIAGTALYTWKYGFELWMPILCVGMFIARGPVGVRRIPSLFLPQEL